jgi:hypothetical protein
MAGISDFGVVEDPVTTDKLMVPVTATFRWFRLLGLVEAHAIVRTAIALRKRTVVGLTVNVLCKVGSITPRLGFGFTLTSRHRLQYPAILSRRFAPFGVVAAFVTRVWRSRLSRVIARGCV